MVRKYSVAGVVTTVFAIIITLMIVLYNFAPMWSAKWWIIDDHEIALFLGEDQKINFTEIVPTLLSSTEVGSPFVSVRFRPSYYTLRLVEAYLFGKNAEYYYRLKIAFAFVFFFLLLMTICFSIKKLTTALTPNPPLSLSSSSNSLFALLIASVATASIAVEEYWRDIFARNGAGEVYCAVGLWLYLVPYFFLWKNSSSSSSSSSNQWGWMWALLSTLGLLIACGSKENFLILLLPSMLLLYRLLRARKLGSALIHLIGVAGSLFIAFSVFIALTKTGSDVYGRSVTFSDRLTVLVKWVFHFKPIHLNLLLTLLLAFLSSLSLKKLSRFSKFCVIAQLFNFALFFSQVIFYNGLFPVNYRYDFPGKLTYTIGLWINLAQVYYLLLSFNKRWLISYFFFPGVLVGLLLTSSLKFARDNNTLAHFSLRTNIFTSSLEQLANKVKEAKMTTTPIILLRDSQKQEEVISLFRFFNYYGIHNPIKVINYPVSDEDLLTIEATRENCIKLYFVDHNALKSGVGDDKSFKCVNQFPIILNGDPL
ncbi:MAG: hypothetical protein HQK50_18475 [Oligoflexia bacterium]|nr:hypothetical protein [Oligoflexia bacterium]